MIDRADVEMMIRWAEQDLYGVEPPINAAEFGELCRVYLAYLDAPVGMVNQQEWRKFPRPSEPCQAVLIIDDRDGERWPELQGVHVRLVTDAEAK